MPEAMLTAYANALPQAMPNPQCTDGRTDGQDEEPPSKRDQLPVCDARDASGDVAIGEVG